MKTDRLAWLCTLALAGACGPLKSDLDDNPDRKQHLDAGLDFSVPAQVTHVGPTTVTCCVTTSNNNAHAFYLSDPVPGRIDNRGIEHPVTGTLHISTPYGIDFAVGNNVPAFGYAFSPDGRSAMYLTATAAGDTFALNMAHVTAPKLDPLVVKQVIPQGLTDSPLGAQVLFSPSGKYLLVGATAVGVMNSPDLHVVDIGGAHDAFVIPNGEFSYQQVVTADDALVLEDSTHSSTPGVPSVEGLYILSIAAAISGAKPTLIDTHATTLQLSADTRTIYYLKTNNDLMLYDIKEGYFVKIASDVVKFTLGPERKGPIAYVSSDLSLHVMTKLRPEIVSTPAHSIDLFSQVMFSPDVEHAYFFKSVLSESFFGDLWHLKLPPTNGVGPGAPSVTGKPDFVAARVSMQDLHFLQGRLMYVRNIDTTGDTGELVSAALDGSDVQLMATGVATGVQVANPAAFITPRPKSAGETNPPDLLVPPAPPIFANLVGATRTPGLLRIADGSRPVTGALAFGQTLGGPEATIEPLVHVGGFEFSEDGYTLLYIGGARYVSSAFNYVGSLSLFQTVADLQPKIPMLDGVSELSAISQRTVFVSAPGAATPGMYFIKY